MNVNEWKIRRDHRIRMAHEEFFREVMNLARDAFLACRFSEAREILIAAYVSADEHEQPWVVACSQVCASLWLPRVLVSR